MSEQQASHLAIVRLPYRGAQFVGGAIFLPYLVPSSILFIPHSTVVFHYGIRHSVCTYPHLFDHPCSVFDLAVDRLFQNDPVLSSRNAR
jgi:hypothetical protein